MRQTSPHRDPGLAGGVMGSKVLLVGSAVWLLLAPPCARPGEMPAQADLAERIHKSVTAKMPREYEDHSGWGRTIPLPPTLRFPRLRRTFVKVGDHYELPDGTWRRTRVWVNDPDRDLRIRVPEVCKVGKHRTRLLVEATLA